VYAVSIHCRLAVEMWSERCAEGRAMITTEASSTTISWATAMTARARNRLGSAWVPCWASELEMSSVVVIWISWCS
jgi:hypothetical protein